MAFQLKYPVAQRYLPKPTERRRGYPMTPGVRFIVAHDTGNPNSTAAQNVAYFSRTANPSANPDPAQRAISSAHIFVDDTEIVECIPALGGPPEKAWHVRSLQDDTNRLFGYHANDAAIGIEYCFGTHIDADQAYRRYVWVIAYACHLHQLDPATAVVGHFMLDPHRKTDPLTGLGHSRRCYAQLLLDVVGEYTACGGQGRPVAVVPAEGASEKSGTVTASVRLNVRNAPTTMADVFQVAEVGTALPYCALVHDGQAVNGNPRWYKNADGHYFWSGGTIDGVAA